MPNFTQTRAVNGTRKYGYVEMGFELKVILTLASHLTSSAELWPTKGVKAAGKMSASASLPLPVEVLLKQNKRKSRIIIVVVLGNKIWVGRRCINAMSSKHLGNHVVPSTDMGHWTSWNLARTCNYFIVQLCYCSLGTFYVSYCNKWANSR